MSSTKKRENDSDVEEQEDTKKSSSSSNKKAKTDTNAEAVFSIGKKRKVMVGSFKGMTLINIREFYEDRATGDEKPSNKGIALSVEQWKSLKEQMAEIDAAVNART